MIDEEVSEEFLKRFLSGELPEDERERLEKRMLLEPELFDRVLATEIDLVDDYIRNELPEESREALKERINASPRLSERVQFAHSLAKLSSRGIEEAPDQEPPIMRPWWRGNLDARSLRQGALAALALLAIGGCAWLLSGSRRLQGQIAGLRQERQSLTASLRDAESRLEQESQRSRTLVEELDRQRGITVFLEEKLGASSGQAAPSATRDRSIQFVLGPSLRGGSGAAQLELPRDVERLELLLEGIGVSERTYRATVRNERGTKIWESEGLSGQEYEWGPSVALSMPSERLPEGTYVATLFAAADGGALQAVGNYPFSVAHESGLGTSPNPSGKAEFAQLKFLEPGATFEGALHASAVDMFSLRLEAGQYFYITAAQQGIDLALALLGPDARLTDETDLYQRGKDTEELYGVTHVSGVHRLEVRGKETGSQTSGRYHLTFVELRAGEPEDPLRIAGWKAYAEARELMQSGTPESVRQAIDLFEGILTSWQELGDPEWEASTLDNIGRCHWLLEEVPEALLLYEQALPLWRRSGKLASEANTLNNLGTAQRSLGDLETAEATYERALSLFRQAGKARGEANVLFGLGSLLSAKGLLQPALEHLHRARKIQEERQDSGELAMVLSGLGTAYTHLGRIPLALDHLQKARELLADGTDPRALAAVLANLGVAYEWSGDRTRALFFYRRSLTLNRGDGHRRGEAAVLGNIAYLYRQLGDFEQASTNYQRSLQIHRQLGRADDEARALMDLGYVRFLQGHAKQALEDYDAALPILRKLGSTVGEIMTLERSGVAHAALDQSEAARRAFMEGLRLSSTIDERRWTSRIFLGLGALHEAASEFDQGAAGYSRALNLSRSQGDPNTEVDALVGLARISRQNGRLDVAEARLTEALGLIESLRANAGSQYSRATFLASKRSAYEFAIDLAMERHEPEPDAGHDIAALLLSERARARVLMDLLAEMNIDLRGDVDPDLVARERSLEQSIRAKERFRLERGVDLEDEARAALGQEVTDLLVEYREIREHIRQRSPQYASLTQPKALGLEQIQREVLDRDSVLLEYSLGETRSFLWVTTPKFIRSFELPPRAEIEALARRVYRLLIQPSRRPSLATPEQRVAMQEELTATERQYWEDSKNLSRILIGPALDLLSDKRLVIVADGALHYLPFGALPRPSGPDAESNASNGPPLILDHEVVSLPSASALAIARRAIEGRTPAERSVAILADPVFQDYDPRVLTRVAEASDRIEPYADSSGALSLAARSTREIFFANLSRLRASATEAKEIARLAPTGDALEALGFRASRTTAMSAELQNYRVIHFATHGFVHSAHPELSGVVLSLIDEKGRPQEGFLRLHDIYNLKLKADLVVLSACQTALGTEIAGEGLMGLPRGFIYAGAPRIVASLWKVEDQATAALMKLFYRELLQEGRRPAEALRQAQVSMWKHKQWQHPYYWAAFVIFGEWL